MSLASQVGRTLALGRRSTLVLASDVWGTLAARALVTPLAFAQDRRLVVVAGTTFGGSSSTELAIECAKFVASLGPTALVGDGRPVQPRETVVVSVRDHVSRVGDDALVAARALASHSVPVIVAPTWQAGLDRAFDGARVAIVDGVSQTSPVRAHLALLAVDASQPWGSGLCRPSGDLRAPRAALASACDGIVALGADTAAMRDLTWAGRPIYQSRVVSEGAWVGGKLLEWGAVRELRVGLWTCAVSSDAALQQLAALRVVPRLLVAGADCDMSTAETTGRARRAAQAAIELWLCTARCAVRLPPQLDGAPIGVIDRRLRLGERLTRVLRGVAAQDSRA